MKALGYSNWRIAGTFWVFGLSIFVGTAIGYLGAHGMMPLFYSVQNEDHLIPEVVLHFHPLLAVYLVVLPTAFFALLSVLYSYWKLKSPVLDLLRGNCKNENMAIWGIKFTLDVLGYWAFPTKDGYEIRKK